MKLALEWLQVGGDIPIKVDMTWDILLVAIALVLLSAIAPQLNLARIPHISPGNGQ